jgi:hypothetical protein
LKLNKANKNHYEKHNNQIAEHQMGHPSFIGILRNRDGNFFIAMANLTSKARNSIPIFKDGQKQFYVYGKNTFLVLLENKHDVDFYMNIVKNNQHKLLTSKLYSSDGGFDNIQNFFERSVSELLDESALICKGDIINSLTNISKKLD